MPQVTNTSGDSHVCLFFWLTRWYKCVNLSLQFRKTNRQENSWSNWYSCGWHRLLKVSTVLTSPSASFTKSINTAKPDIYSCIFPLQDKKYFKFSNIVFLGTPYVAPRTWRMLPRFYMQLFLYLILYLLNIIP